MINNIFSEVYNYWDGNYRSILDIIKLDVSYNGFNMVNSDAMPNS